MTASSISADLYDLGDDGGIFNPLIDESDGSSRVKGEDRAFSLINDDKAKVYIESLSASWSYQRDKLVLQNVTFEVSQVRKFISLSLFFFFFFVFNDAPFFFFFLRIFPCWLLWDL